MRKRLGYLLLSVVLLVGLVFLIQRTSSKATLRRYIAELKDKGEKLSWSELLPTFSTNLEHSASRDIFATNKTTGSFLTPQVMMIIDDGKARIGWKGELHWEGVYTNRTDLKGTKWEMLKEQNKEQAKNLELFRLALKNPSPNLGPRTNSLVGSHVNYPLLRRVAFCFLAEAIENLHNNKPAAAFEDIEQIIALTKLNKEEPMLAAQMIRTAIANVALMATWELMQSPELNEEMLSELQRSWQDVALFDALENGFLGERAYGYEMLQKIQTTKGTELRRLFTFSPVGGSNQPPARGITWSDFLRDHVVYPWYKMTSADDDGLFYLKCLQDSLESARQLKSGVPWSTVKPFVDSSIKRIDRTLTEDKFNRFVFSSMAIPNYSKAVEAAVRAETLRRLTITAIALKRFQLRHGEMPKDLKSLTPYILVEVPIDPMSGKPVCYRLNPDGSYVLYSAGEDGKDDGGIGGMGLWSGKDVVWPIGVEQDSDDAVPRGEKVK